MPAKVKAQQLIMPQGTFFQTCSPVLGEKYVFDGKTFQYFSDELKIFGQGHYVLRKNRLILDFTMPGKLPAYNILSIQPESSEGNRILVKLFSPGGYRNNTGVMVKLLDQENNIIKTSIAPVTDSIVFKSDLLTFPVKLVLNHPMEDELVIAIKNDFQYNINVEVFFLNNWQKIIPDKSLIFKIQNIRTSSFLIEKKLVRKNYFCVFIRQDQLHRLKEQFKP